MASCQEITLQWGGAGRGKVERSCETEPVPFTTAVQYWFRKGARSPRGLCPPAAELHLRREQDAPLERFGSPAKMMQGPHAFPTLYTTKIPPTPSRKVIPTNMPAGRDLPPTAGVQCRMDTEHTDDLSKSVIPGAPFI